MRQIAQGIASAHGVEIRFSFNAEFIETINSPQPVKAAIATAETIGLEVIPNREPMSFSEDFAHFAAAKPACFFLMGNGTQGAHGQPLHAADYDFNDALTPIGVKFWQQLVQDRLPNRKG